MTFPTIYQQQNLYSLIQRRVCVESVLGFCFLLFMEPLEQYQISKAWHGSRFPFEKDVHPQVDQHGRDALPEHRHRAPEAKAGGSCACGAS